MAKKTTTFQEQVKVQENINALNKQKDKILAHAKSYDEKIIAAIRRGDDKYAKELAYCRVRLEKFGHRVEAVAIRLSDHVARSIALSEMQSIVPILKACSKFGKRTPNFLKLGGQITDSMKTLDEMDEAFGELCDSLAGEHVDTAGITVDRSVDPELEKEASALIASLMPKVVDGGVKPIVPAVAEAATPENFDELSAYIDEENKKK